MTHLKDELIRDVTKDSGLTEQEEFFLDVLFDKCSGDVPSAMNMAGYPRDFSPSQVAKKLSKQIKERSKDYLAAASAKASYSLVKVLVDPSAMGAKNSIAAAKEILDRAGVKDDEVIRLPDNAIVILPPKNKSDE